MPSVTNRQSKPYDSNRRPTSIKLNLSNADLFKLATKMKRDDPQKSWSATEAIKLGKMYLVYQLVKLLREEFQIELNDA